jgi:2-polyprenyl-3-methyl-5-hydroxy-6-metoxy-1,4-benzoquinol methylase
MDVVERLTLEAAQADTMLAAEHRQRYEFATTLCGGLRVVDLCCGSGYGTQILSGHAEEVLGVDIDVATVDAAQAGIAATISNVRFEAADALEFLASDRAREFDAIVCFEGLEHLQDLERALGLLREHADRGRRLVVSVPNDKLFREHNPFHVTAFGYDEARRAFGGFPATVMVPQFLAEGSIIAPPDAQDVDCDLDFGDRYEPEYANHFIFCANFEPEALQKAHHGRFALKASPVFNRWSEDLKHAAWALRRENARLARTRLGKGGSAAAAALAAVADSQTQISALSERLRVAEERVRELEALQHGEAESVSARAPTLLTTPDAVEVFDAAPPQIPPGEDPNSWEQRRRRAAAVLVPWIEQSVPLAGKTVLEYGCGNAAVSCAVAERAGRVIGIDIDADAITLGEREVRARGIENIQLELQPLQTILEAVRAHQGEVDVFLLYAVLEHLTLQERLDVLRLAREVVNQDGAIVVCETPNRLIYFDHHTARMPFFHLLPDELAAEYYARSQRDEDFKPAIDEAAKGGPEARLEAIVRWGRGVSFHEFELLFEDLGRHVIASSYDPLLFPERPVHPDEVILSRYLERWLPNLAPAWSRYWLDVILSPQPLQRRPPWVRPWTAETIGAHGAGWTRWENVLLEGPGARLPIELPHATERVLIGSVTQGGGPLAIILRQPGRDDPLVAVINAPAHHTGYSSFRLPVAAQSLIVEVSRACHIVFIGYED